LFWDFSCDKARRTRGERKNTRGKRQENREKDTGGGGKG